MPCPTKIFRYDRGGTLCEPYQYGTCPGYVMAEDKPPLGSSNHTYHCMCSTLILATPYDLSQLPIRDSSSQDQAIICPLGGHESDQAAGADGKIASSTLHNVTLDRKPLIIRREDGFEKRVSVRCTRCNLIIGYRVEGDAASAIDRNVFLLPGGLSSTEDMKAGKVPQQPAWAAQTA